MSAIFLDLQLFVISLFKMVFPRQKTKNALLHVSEHHGYFFEQNSQPRYMT